MKIFLRNLFLLAACVFVVLTPGAAGAAEFDFMLGISQGAPESVPVMRELGIHWGRLGISWKEVMPEIKGPLPELDDVLGNDAMVDELIRNTDWSAVDEKVRCRIENGVQPIPIVGSGWHGSHAVYNGGNAYPDRIGPDHYLAFMYLYTRAVVERYDGDGRLDAPGLVIKVWQTENELNQAGLTAGWGWREPGWFDGLNSCWADWDFLTKLLSTLYRAVHDADPDAMTCMNFHTDIHPNLNRLFHQPDWPRAVEEWQDLMDIIGFDAYPNYYSPDPVRAEVIGERVRTIKEIAGDKPVVLVEIDYPYGPESRGFTPAKQAEFLRRSYDAARAAGVDGYFKFRVVDPEDNPVEITQKDLDNLDKIIPPWEQGKVFRLLVWALPRASYIRDHFLDVLKSVEGHWGVISPSGEKMPAYFVLEQIVAENSHLPPP